MSTIQIGWAERDITPKVPVALMGWAVDRFADEVRDPLSVTALAFDSASGDNAILVSCDLLWIEQQLLDRVRERLSAQLSNFDANKLILFATHTHNAPYTSPEQLNMSWGAVRSYRRDDQRDYQHPADYFELLVERITEAAAAAWNNRQTGGVSYGYDRLSIGQNRRVVYDDGTVQMYGNTRNKNFLTFEGPEDDDVELLYLWDADRRLTGVAVNIACPSQLLESRTCVSSDFWSEVRVELRRKFGHDIYLLPMLGPSGDVIPHEIIRTSNREVSVSGNEIAFHFRQRDFEVELRRTARHIVFAIEQVLQTASQTIQTQLDMKHVVKHIELPIRRVTKTEADEAKKQYEAWKERIGCDPMDRYDEWSRQERFALANMIIMIRHYEAQQVEPPFKMELHVIKIGDIVMTTNPFELYTDYGLQIKANSAAQQTFNIQLACSSAGYLPTEKAVAGSGYGAQIFNGKIGPEGGRLLVDHTVALIHELCQPQDM